MIIAVLALQGAFIEHRNMLDKLGIENFEIRNKDDLKKHFDALILPGGESTVMGKLLKELDLFDELKNKIENGLPVFGTCAGMILLAKKLHNDDTKHFATMDIEVKRNAFGRQLGSFISKEKFSEEEIEMVFIRGPYVYSYDSNVEVLSTIKDKVVAVRQKNMLAVAFHPELTNNTKVHEYFIKMIKDKE